jgi:glycosyltransferase involved in cell wall biosynthesis
VLRDPLVSVVIAVKDGERYLGQAIESVLAQTYEQLEIVVVDGHSKDRSAEIARSHAGVRCLPQEGTGFADAWNQGVEAAAGDLLAFLDSDDLWLPAKLEKQLGLLGEHPETDYVISRMRFLREPGEPLPAGFRPHLLDGDHVANMPSALLLRRSAFEAVGPFRTNYSVANDIDWFARAKDLALTLGVVPEPLVLKRVHGENLSSSETAAENLNAELLDLLRDSVARSQGAGTA